LKNLIRVYRLEPCADVIVPAAARQSMMVCGGEQNFFSKISEKISFYPQNFLMTFLWGFDHTANIPDMIKQGP